MRKPALLHWRSRRDQPLIPAHHFGVLLLLLLTAVPLFGAESSSTPSFPLGGIGALIMWAICSSRKKQEIGGWLLYYYIQLYIACLASVVLAAVGFKSYLPSAWAETPELYPLFLLSTLPAVLIVIAQLIIAEALRRTRNQVWLRRTRVLLWIDLASVIVATSIDLKYFEDNLLFDILGFVWPAIWLPYFYVSTRVKRVFIRRDWLQPPPAPAVLQSSQPAAGEMAE